jgi:hypothetical protein
LIAFLQFGSLGQALLAAAVPLGASMLIGIGLQTVLMGRTARMNAVVVFVALLFFGMVWGAWGSCWRFRSWPHSRWCSARSAPEARRAADGN